MALQKKPPVVTIIGHVDHGKTTLLDYIRKTRLATKEYGEITQAISAYQIEFEGKKITFIDTPGHEAFSKMRTRGAKIADLVILVISAIDGVMPQTKESLKIIEEAGVPFVVAINKIDVAEASVDRVKTQLIENNVLVEGYGGKIVAVPVSAKTGQGVDQLLEMILLTAEMADLKADPEGDFEAEIIESKADKFCGPVVSLIVKNGSLKKGDQVQAEGIMAKVKMLKNQWGKPIEKALPADPVSVLGFTSLPPVGSLVAGGIGEAKLCRPSSKGPEEKKAEEVKLKIILKADVSGSLEAILDCLPSEVLVMKQGVGEIAESDILMAKTIKAEIYSFNLSFSANILKLAETEKVKIKNFKIIYDLLEDLEGRILKILEPTVDRKIFGKAEILAIFDIRGEKIAGGRVVEGKINKSLPILVQRGTEILAETRISSFKQQKQDINEAETGSEFGVILTKKVDFRPGDMLLSYTLEENK